MRLRLLTWNIFHGRDHPPDPGLLSLRSRLLRISERNETHIQVNRPLRAEFESVLAGASWDVALLQEFPPSWWEPVAQACGAEPVGALTSRNSLGRWRALAARLNPDLVASNEGGSNLTLARGDVGPVSGRAEFILCPGPKPERRVMSLARVGDRLCIANLHASAGAANRARTEDEVIRAAQAAVTWAGELPLVFGGDLNLRPAQSGAVFTKLEAELGLAPVTAPDSLDHLLIRGARVVAAPAAWPPEAREVEAEGLALRLSDHAPVAAELELL